MEKEGVWMALPIAIVEDQAAAARSRVHMVCLRG